MQGRWQGQPTDFFADDPFTRLDDDDPGFYERARLVDHLDTTAIAEISALYGRLIRPRSRILDLMSSWHSHLPQASRPDAVVGLGMNAEELARNPILTERVVHDMNADPRLPFDDASFDAVICTVSVEYLTQPFAVFREMARVLAPAGIAVMTFSNRWFPTKVIRIWDQVHEFERPGLVLEYFRESGRFRDFNTWSLRGLPRPAEDKYAHRLDQSDPVHAVWARRDGEPRVRL
jgi:SAM-dependent methyltransferase